MATVRAWLYGLALAALAFFGLYMRQQGRKDEQQEQVRRRIDVMRTAKDVRDEVESDPYLVDRASEWVRDRDDK